MPWATSLPLGSSYELALGRGLPAALVEDRAFGAARPVSRVIARTRLALISSVV